MLSQETESDVCRWYAIRTKPKEESRADSNLRASGIETFSPRMKASRLNHFSNQPTFINKPLFPGYIFARFDLNTSLHQINNTRGIQQVVGFGKGPTPVDDLIIEMIRSRLDREGFIRIGGDFVAGGQLTVKDGPLKGLAGVLERETKDAERVMLLLTCVSYQGHFVIEKERLKPAA